LWISEWLVVGSSAVVVVAVVVVCCNASNLTDGMDGLCGGVTWIMAAGFLLLATHLAIIGNGWSPTVDILRIVLALALLGSLLGFLPYNFNPASIFMGDVGSLFLGFACALMIILMGHGEHPKWLFASLVIFGLPALDTALAFTRRWLKGRPMFGADRFHLHHQIHGRGLSIRQSVAVMYVLAIGFVTLGCASVYLRSWHVALLWLFAFLAVAVAVYVLGFVHEGVRRSVLGRAVRERSVSWPPDGFIRHGS
jgi:UDP-GlcNAc:undecaprenyl-phosphate/decaprenyl-phosphate GlcNAc-1-phosphate transferase